MKTVLGEYGKLIILAIALCGMILILFGKGEDSLRGLLKNVRPSGTLGHEDTFVLAESILSRQPPELSVTVKKLHKGQEYDLLGTEAFYIEAKNPEGKNAEVSVVRIIGPGQQDITKEVVPKKFTPALPGEYRITYQAADSYQGSIKTTEKEYCFVVD